MATPLRLAAFIGHADVRTFFGQVAARSDGAIELVAELAPAGAAEDSLTPHWSARDLLSRVSAKARCERGVAGLSDVELLPLASARMRSIQAHFDRTSPSAVLAWNGSGFTQGLAIAEARRRGLPVVFGENGFLPATLQLDPEGVNAASAFARRLRAGEHRGRARDPGLAAALDTRIAKYRKGASTRDAATVAAPGFIERLRRSASTSLKGSRTPYATATLPPPDGAPEVLLPLQVTRDSQLLLFSPWVGSALPALIAELSAALAQTDPRARLLVKLHPREARDIGERYAALAPRVAGNVVFIREIPVQQLIPRCKAVVTVNSTVGFEALLLGTPVIVAGEAFYGVEGVARVAHDPLALREHLSAILRGTWSPDPVAVDDLMHFVFAEGLVAASWKDGSDASLAAVGRRLLALAGRDGR